MLEDEIAQFRDLVELRDIDEFRNQLMTLRVRMERMELSLEDERLTEEFKSWARSKLVRVSGILDQLTNR